MQLENNIMLVVRSFEEIEQIMPVDRERFHLRAIDPNIRRNRLRAVLQPEDEIHFSRESTDTNLPFIAPQDLVFVIYELP